MTLTEYAKQFIGVKYSWGGSSVEQGFDCSGFIQEILSSRGLDPKGDQTAQNLYNYFYNESHATPGAFHKEQLLFFGKSTFEITHIAMSIDDNQMIEAGGEGRVSTELGMVRVRPINKRRDLVAVLTIRD